MHAVAIALLLVVPTLAVSAQSFVHSPWRIASTNGGEAMPVVDAPGPADTLFRFTDHHGSRWMTVPEPDALWSSAPDPRTIGYVLDNTIPDCTARALFVHARTSLHLPASVDRASVMLAFDRMDDYVMIVVNGHVIAMESWQMLSTPIGEWLEPGENDIRVVLGDWCLEARLLGARFTGLVAGETVVASLRGANQ